ncbi:MAG TPA: alpha/beta family hydrolase [Acidimicrobiales bacterium]|nr:alpha/beta family hydrolase [Acidimicrobiales bacterium]
MRPRAALLTPGAGASRDQPSLIAIDEALTAAGLVVERMDFPYRKAGRKAPDRPPVLLEAVREGAAKLAARAGAAPDELLLGGRSMGGRICSMAVAEGLRAAGLLLISYPLHPPGKPEQLRTAHFVDIKVPCLFVSGTRDAFGTAEELETATRAIPASVAHEWIDGGDHGLRRKDDAVRIAVSGWLEALSDR